MNTALYTLAALFIVICMVVGAVYSIHMAPVNYDYNSNGNQTTQNFRAGVFGAIFSFLIAVFAILLLNGIYLWGTEQIVAPLFSMIIAFLVVGAIALIALDTDAGVPLGYALFKISWAPAFFASFVSCFVQSTVRYVRRR